MSDALFLACLDITEAHQAATAAVRAESVRTGKTAMERAFADIDAAARRSAKADVKGRARHFARYPTSIACVTGLDMWSAPSSIIAVAEACIEREPARRWIGHGGHVPLVNYRAALLYGRWLRRVYRVAAREVEVAA